LGLGTELEAFFCRQNQSKIWSSEDDQIHAKTMILGQNKVPIVWFGGFMDLIN